MNTDAKKFPRTGDHPQCTVTWVAWTRMDDPLPNIKLTTWSRWHPSLHFQAGFRESYGCHALILQVLQAPKSDLTLWMLHESLMLHPLHQCSGLVCGAWISASFCGPMAPSNIMSYHPPAPSKGSGKPLHYLGISIGHTIVQVQVYPRGLFPSPNSFNRQRIPVMKFIERFVCFFVFFGSSKAVDVFRKTVEVAWKRSVARKRMVDRRPLRKSMCVPICTRMGWCWRMWDITEVCEMLSPCLIAN